MNLTEGDDTYYGWGQPGVLIHGLGGNDTIWGSGNPEDLHGDAGNDRVSVPGPASRAFGGTGQDTLMATSGASELWGGEGNDTLYTTGQTRAHGEDGDDYFEPYYDYWDDDASGSGYLYGGAGNDTFNLTYGDGFALIDGGDGIDKIISLYGEVDLSDPLILNVENASGSGSVRGTDGPNRLGIGYDFFSSRNTLDGRGGADTLVGGWSHDTYIVDDAGDVVEEVEYAYAGTDTVRTSVDYRLPDFVERIELVSTTGLRAEGNALANTFVPSAGNDTLVGDALDEVDYSAAPAAIQLDLDLNTASGGSGTDELLGGIRGVRGSAFGDDLRGRSAAGGDSLSGGDGADTLIGAGGVDVLDGGAGDDLMRVDGGSHAAGGVGDDVFELWQAGEVRGNSGDDTFRVMEPFSFRSQRLDGGDGLDTLVSDGGADLATGISIERLQATGFMYGNAENNLLVGIGRSDDLIVGRGGRDLASYELAEAAVQVSLAIAVAQQTGGGGSDTLVSIEDLRGSPFDDRLSGNSGPNVLRGGGGNDTLVGAGGSDTYELEFGGGPVTIIETDADPLTGGIDTVIAQGSFVLPENVENLVLRAAGSAGTGNAGHNVIHSANGDNVIDGGLGRDTVFYAHLGSVGPLQVDLSLSGPQQTGGSGLETLTGIENITGSLYADRLRGDAGHNVLDGSSGLDTLQGGAGDDNYHIDVPGETLIEDSAGAAGGVDTVYSRVDHALGAHFENLRALGSEGLRLAGNNLENVFFVSRAPHRIDGAGNKDTVSYVYATEGVDVDLRLTDWQYTGGAGVQSLLRIEALIGSLFDDGLRGSEGHDTLHGSAGNDTLEGAAGNDALDGGSGADVAVGGAGSDYYWVDHADDLTLEVDASLLSGGHDMVLAHVSHALQAHIEDLRLLGSGAIDGTGNALDNVIFAGAGDNVIDGGAGADSASFFYMTGGVRVDLSLVGAQNTLASGNDSFIGIEKLIGSGHADNLVGNAGPNTLDGGAGADVLRGGDGRDLYVVDHVADRVIESNAAAAGGIDLIYTTVSFTLPANVENLRQKGSADIAVTGNALDNALYPGAGANAIDGGAGIDTVHYAYATAGIDASLASGQVSGGSGNDTLAGIENLTGSPFADVLAGDAAANVLRGAAGADTFVLNGLLASDTIADFVSGTDKLRISQAGIVVGNGDAVIDGAVSTTGPGGFAATAELVIVGANIAGAISTTSAAAAIGSASAAYTAGQRAVFVVDNGGSSAAYLFTSADANAVVAAGELTLLANLSGAAATTIADWEFGADWERVNAMAMLA